MFRSARVVAVSVAILGSVAGAPAQADSGTEAVLGALLGAGSGAVLGQAVAGRDGAMIGGALGAMVGTAAATRPVQPVHYIPPTQRGWYGAAPVYAPAPTYPVAAYPQPYYPAAPVVVYRSRPFCEEDLRRMHGHRHYRTYRSVEYWRGHEYGPSHGGRW